MYTLFKNVGLKKIAISELPSLGISLLVAEEFYKFGSFTIECVAFFATWYLISFIVNTIFPRSTT